MSECVCVCVVRLQTLMFTPPNPSHPPSKIIRVLCVCVCVVCVCDREAEQELKAHTIITLLLSQ